MYYPTTDAERSITLFLYNYPYYTCSLHRANNDYIVLHLTNIEVSSTVNWNEIIVTDLPSCYLAFTECFYDPAIVGNISSVSGGCVSKVRQQRNVQDRLLAALQLLQLAARMWGGTTIHEGLYMIWTQVRKGGNFINAAILVGPWREMGPFP